jgi:opacity protein-like surface antigen
MRSRLLAAVLLAGSTASASAVHALDQPGWFVAGQFGRADYDLVLKGDAPWWGRVDDSASAWAVGVGYTFTPHLGARLMYERSGGFSVRNACPPGQTCPALAFQRSADADNWSMVLLPRLALGGGWDLYGTIGAMRWEIDPGGRSLGRIASDDGTELLYGGGLGYRFRGGAGVELEYQRSAADYSALRLGLTYSFR